jgi:lysophospholipase L1-like esterase
MTINKIIITVVFIVFTTVTNGQELIQAGKYDDLMSAPEIAIAGGGSLIDWANMNFYKDSNDKLKKITDTNRVVFMGNSITQGWSHFNASFFKNNPFINRGIGGQTSPQMLVRFRTDVVNLNPKAVVIMAGTNDIAGNTGLISIENTAENIFSMAEIAIANNIAVYICSTLPAIDFLWSPGLEPASKIVKLNTILKSYCKENGLTYVDYYAAMVDAVGGLKVPDYTAADDLVHPNIEGYKVMEKIILASLKK